jgi:hypothetical protein
VADGHQSRVFDFALKRGFFNGEPRLMPDGQTFRHKGVRGKGVLVKMDKAKADAAPATVNVGNWKEGGDAFAQAFGPSILKLFETMLAQARQIAASDAGDKGKKAAKVETRAWTQEDLDKAIAEYKAQRAAAYKELVDGVKKNLPAAKKAAKRIYGRNAIARALGVKSPSMVSRSPDWIQIAEELGLELARKRKLRGTRHTRQASKIGLDIAVEQKSEEASEADEGAESAPAESTLESAERAETIRQINRLARAEKTPQTRKENERAAEELLKKLQRDEISDDEARQIVELTLNPNK